jgi:dolichol-phosphate mannosyltransferase
MNVVIVIPTYNEKENTEKMIDKLSEVFDSIKDHSLKLLYVDGNSPDGTADVVRQKQKKYKWLELLVETKKEGLGMAYAKGMTHAMKNLKADYIMEFDADFQHNPDDIPRLVEQINSNYDYIIGSRYINGGSIPKEWGFDRKVLSVFGNLLARTLLLIPRIHDVTGGFRLARVKGFMDEFDFSKLLSRSFAYKIHLLFYMVKKGAKVKEVPIKFMLRTRGDSKIIKNEMVETLRVIYLLQMHNPKIRKFIKFAIVGFIGYLVNATSLHLFTIFEFSSLIAWGLSTELAILSNFTWNNLWTFKSQKITGLNRLLYKFLQFNFTSMGGLIIQVLVGVLSDKWIGPGYRQIVLPLSILFLILPYNYAVYNLIIWKSPQSKQ